MRRVGVLMAYAESDPEVQARVVAFRQGLRELGWTEGHNVQMDYRYGTGEPDRARIFVTEWLSPAPDVIVAHGTPALTALHRATRTIPVVFVSVIDPVGAGYVESLALPGGNITGFSTFELEIGGKWLELLKEVAPGLRRVAGILDPGFRGFATGVEQRKISGSGFTNTSTDSRMRSAETGRRSMFFRYGTRIMVEWCDATSCHGVDRRQRARRITSRMDCSGSGGRRARAAAIGASPRARQYWSRHSEASSSCPPGRRNR